MKIPQPGLEANIDTMKVGSRFIAQYPGGRFSLFRVRRKRGTSFECAVINGAHSATFDQNGYCKKYKMNIVYVRPNADCPYTVMDYNQGLNLFSQHYKEAQDATH